MFSGGFDAIGIEDCRLVRNTYLMAFSLWVDECFNYCKPKASLSNPQEGDRPSVSRGRGRGRQRGQGRGRGLPVDALGMGDGGGDEKDVEVEEAVMCWVCKVEPRLSVKCRCCKACKQYWDCFEKDAKRKNELEYLK